MRYTFIQQHDATDCAAACLAMICLHYRKETTITQLRDMMGTDLKGTNLLGLSQCAQKLGFVSQAVRVDREGFVSKYTLPAIANIVTKEGLSHFVVVFKITKKYVVIGDPAKDLLRLEIDEFYKMFPEFKDISYMKQFGDVYVDKFGQMYYLSAISGEISQDTIGQMMIFLNWDKNEKNFIISDVIYMPDYVEVDK